jgi:hypothetical protein
MDTRIVSCELETEFYVFLIGISGFKGVQVCYSDCTMTRRIKIQLTADTGSSFHLLLMMYGACDIQG